MSAQFTAFLDTNVLYDAPLRDLLLEMAVADLFQARWSIQVLEELRRVFAKERPDIGPAAVDRLIELMNAHVRDSLVDCPPALTKAITLPDKEDRHVVAAALQSRAHAIVTWNLRDFPADVLASYRLEAIDPDAFLLAQWDLDQGRFMSCVATVRRRLHRPAVDANRYIDILIRHGLVGTGARLREVADFI